MELLEFFTFTPLVSHSWKVKAPLRLVTRFPPQGKQEVRPTSGWYIPSGQGRQGMKPSCEYWPGEHWPEITQAFDRNRVWTAGHSNSFLNFVSLIKLHHLDEFNFKVLFVMFNVTYKRDYSPTLWKDKSLLQSLSKCWRNDAVFYLTVLLRGDEYKLGAVGVCW